MLITLALLLLMQAGNGFIEIDGAKSRISSPNTLFGPPGFNRSR